MRVVNPKQYNTIKNSDFVVVKWNGDITVVMQYDKNNYISARLSMDPNTWQDKWGETSKAAYCTKAHIQADAEAIVFDNFREMVTWLAKEENGR